MIIGLWQLLICGCLVMLNSFVVMATPILPSGDSEWYYRIGGGESFRGFSGEIESLPHAASPVWSEAMSCDFDIQESVTSYMNNLHDNLYSLQRQVIDEAKSLMRLSALGVLQRANPGLYDLLTKGVADARERFTGAVNTCQRHMENFSELSASVGGWTALSRQQGWRKAQREGDELLATQHNLAEEEGNIGVTWINGQEAGGQGQKPLAPIADVIRFAFAKEQELTLARQVDSNLAVWADVNAAIAWIVSVVGDKHIMTCKDCKRISTSTGAGLRGAYTSEHKALIKQLQSIMTSKNKLPDLLNISAPGMGILISSQVLDALAKEPPAEQQLLGLRLMSEVALARTMEKALATKQLLRRGRQEPNLAANELLQKEIQQALDNLDKDIEHILLEQKVRREVLTGTAATILQRARQSAEHVLLPPRMLRLPPSQGGFPDVVK